MKNMFRDRFLLSSLLIVFGSIKLIFNKSVGFNFGFILLLLGGILLLYSIASYIKSRNNTEVEKELSKEYDERDMIIDGKVAYFSLNLLVCELLIFMFLSNFVVISINAALFILLVSLIISDMVSRKFYNHVL
ncbi:MULTISPECIES: hypothetical protein [Bacillaceae]|uniref:DUF2178 domain-containing protein n=1 Tax=Gottfriedia luciferensis TaxID=178774 RepID=A0ABX2ZN33_9BACI|nr:MULTISPECIES: hypothetical protein [Bacillaceae]ODG91033.1 hypothetical protein BED47_08370 [Gottfriedia luciferensis]SFC82489.1 hypothetical protein SAMN02799633_01828 [Bacillus sp. UNCCL81]